MYILIMIFSTVFDYCNGRLLEYFENKGQLGKRKGILILSVVGNLGILCFFKYTDFLLQTINQLTGNHVSLLKLALPIGISFYTFQTMSYTIDVYRGKVQAQHNFIAFGMYVCLFPQLIAGPIVRYQHIEKEIINRQTDSKQCMEGLQRFIIGLGKKVLFANQIGELWNMISGMSMNSQSVMMAWLGAVSYTFQIYFDFSGYSDMAIGMGKMLGFHFPENFNYPYEADSITEFWRRWHMTLGSWFREYVYIPLGGNRRGILRQIFNLFVVWGLTGLWHGAGWNFVLWGLYFFVLLLIEKSYLLRFMEKWPKWCRHIYALFFIVFGWVIFANDKGMACFGKYCKALFGIGVPMFNQESLYEWGSYLLIILLLVVAATHYPKKMVLKLSEVVAEKVGMEKAENILFVVKCSFCTILLFLSLALLISGTYNPFLYFRF